MSDVLKFDSFDKKTTGNLEDYISTADDMLNDVLAEMNVKHVTLEQPVSEMRREWAERIVKDTLKGIGWEQPAKQLALFKSF